MRRFFKAALRRDKKAAALRAEWEKTDPPRALVEYAAAGDLGKVEELLAAGVDANDGVMMDLTVETVMETPLCAAASGGHVAVARALVAAGAQIDKPSDDGFTPLLNAAVNGWPLMVQYLHEQGADINARENFFNHTPLHKAARLGRAVTVETLLALGADRSLRDGSGKTAEEMVCVQCGGSAAEKEELTAAIQKAFADDRALRAARIAEKEAAEKAYARELAHAGELQRDLPLKRAPQIRARGRKP